MRPFVLPRCTSRRGCPRAFTLIELPAVRKSGRCAFTLIELLVVISVIAILAGMLLPALRYARESARKKVTRQLITQIGMALEQYRDTYGEAPPERTPGGSRLYSSECLAIFLGRGLVPGDPDNEAIRAKRDFLTLRESILFDHDDNNFNEIIDAWGLPILYNRTRFTSGAWWCSPEPLHNTKTYDIFSCGPRAHRMTQLGKKLPNLGNFETEALRVEGNPAASDYKYLYKYEYATVGRRANEYIGNW